MKEFYTTKQIKELTGIRERTLRYRLKALQPYSNNMIKKGINEELLIHKSLIRDFIPKYKTKTATNIRDMKTFGTWAMRDNYDVDYHTTLINEVENEGVEVLYSVIEKTKQGINHLHFISSSSADDVFTITQKVLNQYLDRYQLDVQDIDNQILVYNYLRK